MSLNAISQKKYEILVKHISWGNFWCYFATFTALLFCSTMGVGRQSRRVCFGAKPDKGFLDKKKNLAVSGSGKGTRTRVDDATQERELVAGQEREELVAGPSRETVETGQERGEQQKLAWKNGGAVNTRHRAERRGDKIGSSEEESQDVWFQ